MSNIIHGNFGRSSGELHWLDQPAKTSPPFTAGDLFERAWEGNLIYYRVDTVDDQGFVTAGHRVGIIEDADTPQIRNALSQ